MTAHTLACPYCAAPLGEPIRTTVEPSRIRRVRPCTGCAAQLASYEHVVGDKRAADTRQLGRVLDQLETLARVARGLV